MIKITEDYMNNFESKNGKVLEVESNSLCSSSNSYGMTITASDTKTHKKMSIQLDCETIDKIIEQRQAKFPNSTIWKTPSQRRKLSNK